jgi:hypothetical protein
MSSLAVVIMVLVGAVLIYAAVKGEDPRDLVKRGLTKGGA